MKKIKLNNSVKMNTTEDKKQPEDNLSKSKNQNQEPGKTRDMIEDAEILQDKTGNLYESPVKNEISEQMDEIIRNNDKFETIRVLMEILCKELGISVESGIQAIAAKLKEVSENYYKSMEEWRELNKNSKKEAIRQ